MWFQLSETLKLLYCLRVITKSTVLVSPPVKICDFFFHCWHVDAVSKPHRSRVGAMLEKPKKKDITEHRNPARRTRSNVRHNAKNGVSMQPSQAIDIKALAAIQALEFGLEVRIDQAIKEGDSKIVVKALVSKDLGLASFGLLIEDACIYATSFSKFSYSHIKREGK